MMLASLVIVSCGNGEGRGELEHVPNYTYLRSRVTSCDTLGFLNDVCVVRDAYGNVPKNKIRSYRDVDADILLAWSYAQFNRLDSSSYYAYRALEGLRQLKDTTREEWINNAADMEYVLAVMFYEHQQADSSLVHIQKSLDLARRSAYSHRIVQLHILIAQACVDMGNLSECLSNLRTVEIILDTVPEGKMEPACRMTSYVNTAKVAITIGNLSISDRTLARASILYDKVSDFTKINYIRELIRQRLLFNQSAQVLSALNRYEMLIDHTHQESLHSNALAYKGLARCRIGDLEWGKKYLDDIVYEDLNDEGRFIYYLYCGELAVLQRDYKKAHSFLFDSIQIGLVTNFYQASLTNESRRTYYYSQGKCEEAFELFDDDRRRMMMLHNDYFAVSDRMRDNNISKVHSELAAQMVAENTSSSGLNIWHVLLVVGICCVVCVALLIIVRWRNNRIASKTAEHNEHLQAELNSKLVELQKQAEMIETTNKRISESITYAEHIQHSIMPRPEDLNNFPISGSFVFYSPLDIVSGDFLWFTKKNDYIIICCADCTGHGVPGAFMSMIAATILNDICDRMSGSSVDPAAMLENLDHSLVENLAHNRSESGDAKDGLDVSIVALNLETHQFISSSARRPVVVVKNDEIFVIRGTKRSIGDLEPNIRIRRFENSTFQLSKGDKFYLYTDGYSDQFGGQHGDKMKSSKIENFLSAIRNDDMDEQLLSIQELFMQWKGDYPQTDDVLFVGVCV